MSRRKKNTKFMRVRRDEPWTPFEKITPSPEVGQFEHWSTTPIRGWSNSRYQVVMYLMPPAPHRGDLPCAQLSIKRHDREQVTDWRDLQRIKDEILGTEVEAVQMFPAQSRMLDTANQYHLWALPAKHLFPVGYEDGRIVDDGSDPEVMKAVEEAAEAASHLPNYQSRGQAPREPHHTPDGLSEVGLAGTWWK